MEATLKYALLLYQDKAFEDEWETMRAAERGKVYAEFDAFTQAAEANGAKILGGNELGLSHTATTVRRSVSASRRDGEDFVVTDGPFAEVAEHLGGYFEIEARDLDHVLELVRSLPSGTTEIRPIVEASGQD
jgi:hypothetical protein